MIINNYIVNGKVARDKIAMDIKYRKITRIDIEELCNNPKVKSEFIGTTYSEKLPKNEWNKVHLDRVSYAVIAECFNKDYLLYLNDVADSVAKHTAKKKFSIKILGKEISPLIISGIFVLIIIIIIIAIISKNVQNESKYQNTNKSVPYENKFQNTK